MCGFLCTTTMASPLVSVPEPRVFHKTLTGGVGNGIYGNRIFRFSQPNTNFSCGMWLFLLRNICFLELPPLAFHNPIGLVATAYVDPTTQLLLKQ